MKLDLSYRKIHVAVAVLAVLGVFHSTSVYADGAGLVGGIVGRGVGGVLGKSLAGQNDLVAALKKAADDLNKKMPVMVDSETRMDAVEAGPGAKFTYRYTMISLSSRDVDQAFFKEVFSPRVRGQTCANPKMKAFFDNGVMVSHSYNGRDGSLIGTVDIPSSACKV